MLIFAPNGSVWSRRYYPTEADARSYRAEILARYLQFKAEIVKNIATMKPILMTEKVWANSQFSIARYYGRIKLEGETYVIVDKKGRDLFECSIKPGEPADLINEKFLPLYKKYGRDKFIEVLKANPQIKTVKDMKSFMMTSKSCSYEQIH